MSFQLPPRKIGSSSVPPIGFGAMGFAGFYGATESDEDRFKVSGLINYIRSRVSCIPYKLLDAAYAQGCTHWDSANIYNDSEEVIGKWLVLMCLYYVVRYII